MAFEKSDLLKVARLARLALTQDEIDGLKDDLHRIVSYIDLLNEVDVSGIKPLCHAGERSLTLRADEVGETLGRKCIDSSPGFEDGMIRVPKIIE